MTFYWILFLRNVVQQLRSVVMAGRVISRGQFSPIPVTTSFTLYYSLPVFLFRCSLFTAALIPLFASADVYLIRRFLFAVSLFSPTLPFSPLLLRTSLASRRSNVCPTLPKHRLAKRRVLRAAANKIRNRNRREFSIIREFPIRELFIRITSIKIYRNACR